MANAHVRSRPTSESLGILTGAGGCDYLSTIEVPSGCTIYGKWTEVVIGSGDLAMVYRESSSD